MSHQIAKLLLENANSFLDRKQAVQSALDLGMPIHEIQEYLDWLELVQASKKSEENNKKSPDTEP